MSKFQKSINISDLTLYVTHQLNNFFPDNNKVLSSQMNKYVQKALDRVFECFQNIKLKYYNDGHNVLFNHLNSDHYCMFLYLLSNTIYKTSKQDEVIATKVFLLNKALHGIDVFYSVELPKVFLFAHPLGTVLGHAHYSDNFCVFQGCSVGVSSEGGKYPTIGKNVLMYSNSKILGNCNIGENIIFGGSSMTIDSNIDSNSIVVGNYPNNRILENTKDDLKRMFK